MTSMENKIDKCMNRIWVILYSKGSHLRTVYLSDKATITVGSTLNLFTLRSGLTEAYENEHNRNSSLKLLLVKEYHSLGFPVECVYGK